MTTQTQTPEPASTSTETSSEPSTQAATPVAETPTTSDISPDTTPVEPTSSDTEAPGTILQTATAEPKADEEPAKEDAPKDDPEVANEGYEITLEENSPLTQEDLDAIAAEASTRGLTEEQAGELIKLRESMFSRGDEFAKQAELTRQKTAAEEFNKDLDFVGDKKAESFASIHRAAKAFGGEDLMKALNDPYVGNNLPLAKFLKKIGDALKADDVNGKGTFGKKTPENSQVQTLKNMYPEHFIEK